MDAIIWFDEYSKENNDLNINRSYNKELEYDRDGNKFSTGTVKRIANNGWGTVSMDREEMDVSVYKGIIEENGIKEGDRLKFIIDSKRTAKDIVVI